MKRVILLFLFVFSFLSLFAQDAKLENVSSKSKITDVIIVFKMHFDIGFTDLAESVMQKYSTTVFPDALQTIRDGQKNPKNERFIWTVPSWPIKYVLEKASPEVVKGTIDALKNGSIRPLAIPFTYQTESSDLECMVRAISISSQIARMSSQPLPRDAKLTDVPSHSWFLPTLFTHAGIKILNIGCNSGTPSPVVPPVFWWEGPDGSRLLTFYWAWGYGTGIVAPENWKYRTWMAVMETQDNSTAQTSTQVAQAIALAKKTYPNANIRVGQISDFYDALMKEKGADIPVVRGDMPDVWIYGLMSAPRGVKINKSLQRLVFQAEMLNTLLGQWGQAKQDINRYVDAAVEKMLLFDEHTFGMAINQGHQAFWSYGDDFVIDRAKDNFRILEESWYEKESRLHDAERIISSPLRMSMKQLASSVSVKGKKIVIFNPLPWERSGMVKMYTDVSGNRFQICGLRDEVTGERFNVEFKNNGLEFYARNVPSMGYKTYTPLFEFVANQVKSTLTLDKEQAVLENTYFKLRINKQNGSISSLYDKIQQHEVVNQESSYGLGEYMVEKYGPEEFRRRAVEFQKVEKRKSGGVSWFLGRPSSPELESMELRGKCERIVYKEDINGVSATAFCKIGEDDCYTLTYTLGVQSPYLELIWSISNKSAEPKPEGGWLAFPFNIDQSKFRFGRLGGIVDPTTDYIETTNRNYFMINTGLAVFDKNGVGMGLNSPDAPTVSPDIPGLFRYERKFIPKRGNIFINLFNNQQVTNYTEWIEGRLSARVYLWSINDYQNERSLISPTEETREPMMGVFVENDGGKLPIALCGISLSRKGVLISSYGLDKYIGEQVLRLWEQAGVGGLCTITFSDVKSYSQAQFCDLRGEPKGKFFDLKDGKITVDIGAYQPVSLILR